MFKYEDFFSTLKNKNVTMVEYEKYVEIMNEDEKLGENRKFKTGWDYLEYYNILDTETMIEPISNLIKKNEELKVDMLQNLSYSSCASAEKYAFAYDKFDIKNDYSSIRKTTFKLNVSYWKTKVDNYKKQDELSKRDISENISYDDYEYFRKILENSKCHICNNGFINDIKPTLDRLNNEIGHTKENVLPACENCNRKMAACDKLKGLTYEEKKNLLRLRVILRRFCIKEGLPMTISEKNEDVYKQLRHGINGGLSNVINRVNLKGCNNN